MRNGKIQIILGILFIAVAVALAIFNLVEERRAGLESSAVLEQADELFGAKNDEVLAFGADTPMPVVEIDGRLYIGVLSVPGLGLKLPILSEWSYEGLNVAPCRYAGSAYAGNLVICGHNYRTHFSSLKDVTYGTEIVFADVRGNVFRYEVASVELLNSSEIEPMVNSDYDLTLFTCNLTGTARVAVRCVAIF